MTPDRFAECKEFGAEWEAEGGYPEGAARKMVHELCREVERLTAAVREAVARERERCAKIAEDAAYEWASDIHAGSNSSSLLQGMLDGASIVYRRILEGT